MQNRNGGMSTFEDELAREFGTRKARDNRSDRGEKGKKKKFEEKKEDVYSVEALRNGGHCIKWTSKTGNILFYDLDQVWVRSKRNMKPMSSAKATQLIEEFRDRDKTEKNMLRFS